MSITLTFTTEQFKALEAVMLMAHEDNFENFCESFPEFDEWLRETSYTSQMFLDHIDNFLSNLPENYVPQGEPLSDIKDHAYYNYIIASDVLEKREKQ